MDPTIIIAVVKLAEMAFSGYISIMRQAGLNEEQIHQAFLSARKRLELEDPSLIPDK